MDNIAEMLRSRALVNSVLCFLSLTVLALSLALWVQSYLWPDRRIAQIGGTRVSSMHGGIQFTGGEDGMFDPIIEREEDLFEFNLLGFSIGRRLEDRSLEGISVFWTVHVRWWQVPYWFLALISALMLLPLIRHRLQRRRRRRGGLCLSCGYDMRASSGVCPECGAVP